MPFFPSQYGSQCWKTFSIFLTNLDADGPVQLDFLEVDGTVALDLS